MLSYDGDVSGAGGFSGVNCVIDAIEVSGIGDVGGYVLETVSTWSFDTDLGVVDEGSQPELRDPRDDLVPLVEERPPQLVVLLLDLEDLLTRLLVHGIYLVLTAINVLQSFLRLLVEIPLLHGVIHFGLFGRGSPIFRHNALKSRIFSYFR